jgi:hypothetical protein
VGPGRQVPEGRTPQDPGGAKVYADGGTTLSNRDGWMWDLAIPGGRLTCKVQISVQIMS